MTTILIIEDNRDIRENIVEILELENYKVFAASNGTDGIFMAVNLVPDIILCDIHMPGMNGYDILNVLKKDSNTASIPFVYLTAKVEKDEINFAKEIGATGYISKPFHIDVLLDTISRFVKG
jgi:CheY-like chemotaxis protein